VAECATKKRANLRVLDASRRKNLPARTQHLERSDEGEPVHRTKVLVAILDQK
jgi:hypothetical protein